MLEIEELNKMVDYFEGVNGNPSELIPSGKTEYTFVAIKPGYLGIKAAYILYTKMKENDMEIVYGNVAAYKKEDVQQHYEKMFKEGNKFYPELEEYMTSGPIYGFIIKGENATSVVKKLTGATRNPEPGTLRRELFDSLGKEYNITKNGYHASGEPVEAKQEIKVFLNAVKESRLMEFDDQLQFNNMLERLKESFNKANDIEHTL